MPKLAIGAEIRSIRFKKIKVLKELGAGGQGTVYMVDYDGSPMALKWYHDSVFQVFRKDASGNHIFNGNGQRELDLNATLKALNEFYGNLKNNVENGSPSPEFLWPKDLTEIMNGSFGYVMDLRPKGYYELGTLLLGMKKENGRTVRFESFQARANGMINLVNAFRILHNEGYSYQDLNDGNFFFEPATGKILICDNDNVAHSGYHTGVIGKCRFMAPEVVRLLKMPDTMTDRFSMAVILFYMLFRAHPLEGVSSTPACLTPSEELRIYGTDPVFIFDPVRTNNRPIRGVADHAVRIWNCMPVYIQEAFIRSFSREASTYADGRYQANRLTEMEWIRVLIRFRNSILRCPNCGRETILGTGKEHVCINCGKPIKLNAGIRVQQERIPVHDGVVLFRSQFGACDDREGLDPVGRVFVRDGQYGVQNCCKETWQCTTPSGIQRELPAGAGMPAKPGIRVKLLFGEFEIV